MIPNKVPIRKCIVCSARKPKEEFLMIVRPAKSESGAEIKVMSGEDRKSGRGYYICKDANCIAKAKKTHRIERLLSRKYKFKPERIYELLEKAVRGNE